jgi:hypothetical protein
MLSRIAVRVAVAAGIALAAIALHRYRDLGSPLLSYLVIRALAVTTLVALGPWRLRGDEPWWKNTRLRISLLAALLVTALGSLALERPARSDADFSRRFQQLLASAPEYRPALDDESLHNILFDQGRARYYLAGWNAAKDLADDIIRSRVGVYGDDQRMLAYWHAFLAVTRDLESDPAACRAFLLDPAGIGNLSEAAADLPRYRTAYQDLVRDGARRLEVDPAPLHLDPSYDEWTKAFVAPQNGPATLSAAERDAIKNLGASAPLCHGFEKWLSNALQQPPSKAARTLRVILLFSRCENQNAALSSAWTSDPFPIPPGFGCPEPGTRFVLDVTLDDGQPAVITSLGERGIECRAYANSEGVYGIAAGLMYDRGDESVARAMVKLWPLEIGRTSEVVETSWNGKGKRHTICSVTGYGWYEIDGRMVTGYEIDIAVNDSAYDLTYIHKVIWSPELKWRIAQWTEFINGYDGDGALGEWNLVHVIAPPGPR